MGYDADNQFEGRRFEKRQKRRKVNKVLNLLIGVVVILIIFFGWKLLFSDEPAQTASTESTQPATESIDKPQGEPEELEEKSEEASKPDEPDTEVVPESDEHATVTAGEPDSNIIRSIENSAWKPVGTKQSGSHTIDFNDGSTDRAEMEKSISYGLGIDESDMIVWWITSDGENKVASTIATKDNQHIYRVYISWVEGDGWKPTKIEELRENDSPAYNN